MALPRPDPGLWYVRNDVLVRGYARNMQKYWDQEMKEGEPIVLIKFGEIPHDDIENVYWCEVFFRERDMRLSCSIARWRERFIEEDRWAR